MRLTGVSKTTVVKLLEDIGNVCAIYQDKVFPNLTCNRIECDEICDPNLVSISYIEHQELTMSMSMRRFTRLTHGFSMKIENHMHAVALHYMHYNFVRIQKSLRCAPAMEAGLTKSIGL